MKVLKHSTRIIRTCRYTAEINIPSGQKCADYEKSIKGVFRWQY